MGDDERRRSLRASAGVALAAVLVVAALVVVNLPGDAGPRVPASPVSAGPSTTAASEGEETCYADADAAGQPRELAAGAVAVELCPDSHKSDDTFLTPPDRLTQGVDQLAKRINAAAPKPLAQACEEGFVRTFLVVFVYPDGDRVPLRARVEGGWDPLADPGPCDRISGPDGWRDGAVLTAIRTAWQDQREASAPPSSVTATTCQTEHESLFPLDLATVSAAVLCGGSEIRTLTAGQARELAADIGKRAKDRAHDYQNYTASLTLYTPWGETLTMIREGETNIWLGPHGIWEPSAEIRQWFDPVLAGVPNEEPKVDGDSCEGMAPTSDVIPTDAVTLRLCPSGEPDLQQLTPAEVLATEGAHEVLAALRAQPALGPNPTCRADLGPAFLLIAKYFGREPVVMELELYGCGTAGTSTDRRTGAESVLDAFRSALTKQRQQRTPPNPGTTCPVSYEMRTSVMPVGLDDVVAGVACSSPNTEMSAQRWPDADQLATIIADIAANSDPRPVDACPATASLRLPEALVLANEWEDQLALSTQPCPDSYTYQLNGEQLRWKPSSAVVGILEKLYG